MTAATRLIESRTAATIEGRASHNMRLLGLSRNFDDAKIGKLQPGIVLP